MAFLFGKRSKLHRTSGVKGKYDPWKQFRAQYFERNAVPRTLMSLLTIALLVIGVRGWEAPFPFRLGDYKPHGLTSKVTFEVVNTLETNRLRRDREREVPFVFRNDATRFEALIEQLRASLGAIAASDVPEDLPLDVREAFELVPDFDGDADSNKQQEFDFEFQQLKNAVSGRADSSSDTQITVIVEDFERFLDPIRQSGIISTSDVNRLELGIDSRLAVIPEDRFTPERIRDYEALAESWLPLQLVDVQAKDLLNDAGLLGLNWRLYPNLDPIQAPLERWLRNQMRPTLRYDQSTTQAARIAAKAQVEDVTLVINRGDELLPPQSIVNEEALSALWAEHQTAEHDVTWWHRFGRVTVVVIWLTVLGTINAYYWATYDPQTLRDTGKLAGLFIIVVLTVVLGRWLSFDPWRADVAITLASTMIICIVYNQAMAVLTALGLSLVLTLATTLSIEQFLVLFGSSATAVTMLSKIQSRTSIIFAGVWSGLACLLIIWGYHVIEAQFLSEVWNEGETLKHSLRSAGWCLVAGYFVAGSLPFIETAFGVVTGISLLELSEPSHPLLKELVRKAPGTYNHSITVASMAETAAERIGADGLLVRVGAYFHDIGKIPKAEYFVENMRAGQKNRHNDLAPAMSTLIIIGHVKDGVDMAERVGLPQALIDFIEQHHGTTLVEFFYHAATEQAEAKEDNDSEVEESAFRYPGPKPQSKEAGILMLSDAVESASRALSEPTPSRIERLVHELTMKRLLDGQFDESTLTLREIEAVEESLKKSLNAIYHGRVAYPQKKSATRHAG